MGVIVWILMSTTTHHWSVPTIEFATEHRCINAAKQIKEQVKARNNTSYSGFCVKVEK
jgi:hypothetical protein